MQASHLSDEPTFAYHPSDEPSQHSNSQFESTQANHPNGELMQASLQSAIPPCQVIGMKLKTSTT